MMDLPGLTESCPVFLSLEEALLHSVLRLLRSSRFLLFLQDLNSHAQDRCCELLVDLQ